MTKKDHDHIPDDIPGEMTSVFRADFFKPDPPLATSGERPPPGSALLVITRGPNAGSRLVLDKAVTSAGRHPDSDVYLDDVSVSRRHAEFQVTDDNDVQVVDVGSLNGTYVNRQQVDTATLANGDEVQLGKFRLVFLTGGDKPPPRGGPGQGHPGTNQHCVTHNGSGGRGTDDGGDAHADGTER